MLGGDDFHGVDPGSEISDRDSDSDSDRDLMSYGGGNCYGVYMDEILISQLSAYSLLGRPLHVYPEGPLPLGHQA